MDLILAMRIAILALCGMVHAPHKDGFCEVDDPAAKSSILWQIYHKTAVSPRQPLVMCDVATRRHGYDWVFFTEKRENKLTGMLIAEERHGLRKRRYLVTANIKELLRMSEQILSMEELPLLRHDGVIGRKITAGWLYNNIAIWTEAAETPVTAALGMYNDSELTGNAIHWNIAQLNDAIEREVRNSLHLLHLANGQNRFGGGGNGVMRALLRLRQAIDWAYEICVGCAFKLLIPQSCAYTARPE